MSEANKVDHELVAEVKRVAAKRGISYERAFPIVLSAQASSPAGKDESLDDNGNKKDLLTRTKELQAEGKNYFDAFAQAIKEGCC